MPLIFLILRRSWLRCVCKFADGYYFISLPLSSLTPLNQEHQCLGHWQRWSFSYTFTVSEWFSLTQRNIRRGITKVIDSSDLAVYFYNRHLILFNSNQLFCKLGGRHCAKRDKTQSCLQADHILLYITGKFIKSRIHLKVEIYSRCSESNQLCTTHSLGKSKTNSLSG